MEGTYSPVAGAKERHMDLLPCHRPLDLEEGLAAMLLCMGHISAVHNILLLEVREVAGSV